MFLKIGEFLSDLITVMNKECHMSKLGQNSIANNGVFPVRLNRKNSDKFNQNPVKTRSKSSQDPVKIQSKFSQNTVKIQSKPNQNSIETQLKLSQNPVKKRKIVVTVFWNQIGVLFMDFMEPRIEKLNVQLVEIPGCGIVAGCMKKLVSRCQKYLERHNDYIEN